MTNHEKIKAMSAEEMAEFIHQSYINEICLCVYFDDDVNNPKCTGVNCEKGILDWLNSPAESETHK